jgi:hypothetical protein
MWAGVATSGRGRHALGWSRGVLGCMMTKSAEAASAASISLAPPAFTMLSISCLLGFSPSLNFPRTCTWRQHSSSDAHSYTQTSTPVQYSLEILLQDCSSWMQLMSFNLCSIVIRTGKSVKTDTVCVSSYRPSFQSAERVRT